MSTSTTKAGDREAGQILSGGTCAGSRKACRETSATHTGSETQADQSAYKSNPVTLHDDFLDHIITEELLAEIVKRYNSWPALLEACKDIFAMMDEELLVRNTDRDGDPDWPVKAMQFTMRLAKDQAAIRAAEGKAQT